MYKDRLQTMDGADFVYANGQVFGSFMSCFCYALARDCDCLSMPCGHLLGKGWPGLWLSFVMSNCEVVTFPMVSRVGCVA